MDERSSPVVAPRVGIASASEPEGPRSIRTPRSRIPARIKLKLRSEFRAIFESGERMAGRLVVVCVLRNTAEHKFGVVASRRVGGAVERNRAKRLLREAYRLNQHRLAAPCHMALIARSGCVRARRSEVDADLISVLAKLRCLGAVLPPSTEAQG